MDHFLDFEQPISQVFQRMNELREAMEEGRETPEKDIPAELEHLHVKQAQVTRRLYRNLTPFQRVQVARHPKRPHAREFIDNIIDEFTPLAGDRLYREDPAMIAGLGFLNGRAVAVLGTEKGHNTQTRMQHNFGMPQPEGYRKAQRIMHMADKFGLPLVTFVDTPGAYPGIGAEERGQAEAIATCLQTLMQVNVPVVATITGEGGSGGALAIAAADHVLMLEHSVYSVISPEGCASILWPGNDMKQTVPQAAEALRLTASDLKELNVIDGIIKEPVGGAHRDPELTFQRLRESLAEEVGKLVTAKTNRHNRRQRFLEMIPA